MCFSLALVNHHGLGRTVGLDEINCQTRVFASCYYDVNREVLGVDDHLVGGGVDVGDDLCRAAVGDVDDRGVLGLVGARLGDLVGGDADVDLLLGLDFRRLARLRVRPLEGDVDGLDVVGGDLAGDRRVDLIDDRGRGDRGHDELGALGQRARRGGDVDGHAVAVLGGEGDGRVLDLFVLLLLVGILVLGVLFVSLVFGCLVGCLLVVFDGSFLVVGLVLVVCVGCSLGALVAFVAGRLCRALVVRHYISSVVLSVGLGRCSLVSCRLVYRDRNIFLRRGDFVGGNFDHLCRRIAGWLGLLALAISERCPDRRCVPGHESQRHRQQDGNDLAFRCFGAKHDPVQRLLEHFLHLPTTLPRMNPLSIRTTTNLI